MTLPSLTISARSVHLIVDRQPELPSETLYITAKVEDILSPLSPLRNFAQQLGVETHPAVRDTLIWQNRYESRPPLHLHASFRRLSRETNAQCMAYQRTAAELATSLHRSKIQNVVVDDITCLDVPTLLVLAQLIIMCETMPVQFWLVGHYGTGQPSGKPHERARAIYARRFFARITPLLANPKVGNQLEEAFLTRAAELRPPPVLGIDDALEQLRHYTAVLAYDAAYLGAISALQSAELPMHTAQINETLMLLDLNVFGAETAIERARQLLKSTTGIPQARIAYALGVLQAKRRLDDRGAEQTLTCILKHFSSYNTPSTRLERAWLTNALGLVAALRSSPVDSRDCALSEALEFENKALMEIATDEHEEAVYLRANITTNQVTALEMKGDLLGAITLWRMQTTDQALLDEHECSFHYRLGVLLAKTGETRQATDMFIVALNAATFSWPAGRVRLALAIIAYTSGQAIQARTHLIRLIWEARAMHHWAGVHEALQALHKWNLEMVTAEDIQTAAHLTEVTSGSVPTYLPALQPRPKLLACAPHIDLAASPEADFTSSLINRTLAPNARL